MREGHKVMREWTEAKVKTVCLNCAPTLSSAQSPLPSPVVCLTHHTPHTTPHHPSPHHHTRTCSVAPSLSEHSTSLAVAIPIHPSHMGGERADTATQPCCAVSIPPQSPSPSFRIHRSRLLSAIPSSVYCSRCGHFVIGSQLLHCTLAPHHPICTTCTASAWRTAHLPPFDDPSEPVCCPAIGCDGHLYHANLPYPSSTPSFTFPSTASTTSSAAPQPPPSPPSPPISTAAPSLPWRMN